MSDYRTAIYGSLAGRGVLITGGASGIGAELVRAFAAQGARVAFLDIDDKSASTLVETLPDVIYRHCDLRDIAALRETVAAIDRMFAIDVLINNAGRDDRHDFFSVEPQDWDRYLSFNLHHQFFATQAAARLMRDRGGGSIILLGSISWMRARPGMVAYTTSKAGIQGLTKTLSRELGGFGIRVNSIVPGAISTERQQTLWRTPEINRQIIELQALKIPLEASHIARMALFVASDESAGCTGTNFIVDAGLTQN